MKIGVISDTHGLLRSEAIAALREVDHILHAGDIGDMSIIAALEKIAPVTFVEGNVDRRDGTDIIRTKLGGARILLTHILPRPGKPRLQVIASLREEPADFVVFGHSHLPHDELIDGTRWFNPASAGPRRFDYPVSLGIIDEGGAHHVPLDNRSNAALRRRMNQLARS